MKGKNSDTATPTPLQPVALMDHSLLCLPDSAEPEEVYGSESTFDDAPQQTIVHSQTYFGKYAAPAAPAAANSREAGAKSASQKDCRQ